MLLFRKPREMGICLRSLGGETMKNRFLAIIVLAIIIASIVVSPAFAGGGPGGLPIEGKAYKLLTLRQVFPDLSRSYLREYGNYYGFVDYWIDPFGNESYSYVLGYRDPDFREPVVTTIPEIETLEAGVHGTIRFYYDGQPWPIRATVTARPNVSLWAPNPWGIPVVAY